MNEMINWLKQYIPLDLVWMGVALIAAFGIMWNTFSLFSPLMRTSNTQPLTPSPLPMKHEIKLETSLKAPLFGTYVPDIGHAEVTDSRLSYVVVGILYSTIPHESQALIQGEDGFSKLYRPGDFLTPSLEIKEIQADGVIISNQGRFERLSLPKNDLRFEPLPAPLKMKE